jgi:hypothetical protein
VTPETVLAGPSVQKNAETSVSQSEMPLKIRGAPPRKAKRKNRIQVLISVLAVLARTGYGLLRNSGPRGKTP